MQNVFTPADDMEIIKEVSKKVAPFAVLQKPSWFFIGCFSSHPASLPTREGYSVNL